LQGLLLDLLQKFKYVFITFPSLVPASGAVGASGGTLVLSKSSRAPVVEVEDTKTLVYQR